MVWLWGRDQTNHVRKTWTSPHAYGTRVCSPLWETIEKARPIVVKLLRSKDRYKHLRYSESVWQTHRDTDACNDGGLWRRWTLFIWDTISRFLTAQTPTEQGSDSSTDKITCKYYRSQKNQCSKCQKSVGSVIHYSLPLNCKPVPKMISSIWTSNPLSQQFVR